MTTEQRKRNNKQCVEHRKATGYVVTKAYEKTKKGFLMRLYSNMQGRVLGQQKERAHIYEGLEIITREEFYVWANSEKFHKMFQDWKDACYNKKTTPSVDRIDSKLGYIISNMQWLTSYENSMKALNE